MKTIHKIILSIAAAILALAITAAMAFGQLSLVSAVLQQQLPAARLVQSMALSDGSAAYISIRPGPFGGHYIDLRAIDANGVDDSAAFPISSDLPPDAIQISACNKIVHVFANNQGGAVEYYRFELSAPVATCKDYQVFVPAIIGE